MNDRYERYQRLHESKAVYLVRDIETSNYFVQKIYKYHDGMIYSRLLGLSIPGVPKVISYEQLDDEHVCVIEEYIKGSNLADYISEHGAMSADTVIDYGIRLCNILEKLHKLTPAIIHRDIKPSNILLSDDGTLWLIDFNAAKEFHDDKTSDTYYIGTKDFAAPEQFGFGYSDCRTDVYGLGKTLLYMVNGGYSKQIPENIPARLRNAIVKSTYTDTDRRFPDVIKMRKALEKTNYPLIVGYAIATCALLFLLCFGISKLVGPNNSPTGLELTSTNPVESTIIHDTIAQTSTQSNTDSTAHATQATVVQPTTIATQPIATVVPTAAVSQPVATIAQTAAVSQPVATIAQTAAVSQPTATQPTTAVSQAPPSSAANETEESTRYYTNPGSIPIYNGEFE